MTTGVVNSADLMIFYNGSAIACQTNAKLSITRDMRETTCKQSGAFRERQPSYLEWNMSGDGNLRYDSSTPNAATLLTAMLSGAQCALALKTGVSGDPVIYGNGYLTTYDVDSPASNENCTFSYEFMGTGAIAVS